MGRKSKVSVVCVVATIMLALVFVAHLASQPAGETATSTDAALETKLALIAQKVKRATKALQKREKEMDGEFAHLNELKQASRNAASPGLWSKPGVTKEQAAGKPLTSRKANELKQKTLSTEMNQMNSKSQPSAVTTASFYKGSGCRGELSSAVINSNDDSVHKFQQCGGARLPISVRVVGTAHLDLFKDCAATKPEYWASIGELDGCVEMYTWPPMKTVKFAVADTPHATMVARAAQTTHAKYNFVWSAESSKYFSYQAYANYYGFLHSNQQDASWTRLISSRSVDDLADKFPTFAARRHPYSWRYGPVNKADVLVKWFASPVAPKEDVIVVIDPDSWLTASVRSTVDKVRPGQAYAERAFFAGSHLVEKLWKQLCEGASCSAQLDHVAVPYFVHRDDLRRIAPLWKDYILKISALGDTEDESKKSAADAFNREYAGVQVAWCKEMLAYVFAAAAAGVRHDITMKLQVRDIEHAPSDMKNIGMIHMGRAFFPPSYEAGKNWWMTGAPDFNQWKYKGMQVWCKCNETAGVVLPWPIPDNLEFQSKITLTYLHNSVEEFGPIPFSPEFRDAPWHDYHRGQQ